jgi:hypothetical protein
MKITTALTALTFLLSKSAYSETIQDVENKFNIEAKTFVNHPLYMYLNPEGAKAINMVLYKIKSKCFKENNINSETCLSRRKKAVKRLQDAGFNNVSENDFTDKKLFDLANKYKKLYQVKIKDFTRKALAAPVSEKKAIAAQKRALRKAQDDMVTHLFSSRKI